MKYRLLICNGWQAEFVVPCPFKVPLKIENAKKMLLNNLIMQPKVFVASKKYKKTNVKS